jgi:hypothetical protein
MSLKNKEFLFFLCLLLGACGSRTRLEDRHGLVPSAVGDVVTKSNEDGNIFFQSMPSSKARRLRIMSPENSKFPTHISSMSLKAIFT